MSGHSTMVEDRRVGRRHEFRAVCQCGAESDWLPTAGLCAGWDAHHRLRPAVQLARTRPMGDLLVGDEPYDWLVDPPPVEVQTATRAIYADMDGGWSLIECQVTAVAVLDALRAAGFAVVAPCSCTWGTLMPGGTITGMTHRDSSCARHGDGSAWWRHVQAKAKEIATDRPGLIQPAESGGSTAGVSDA